MVKRVAFNKRAILPLVFFLSSCYLVLLVSSTQKDIFFYGDGGMKYVVIQQLQRGEGFKYLHLGQPKWVMDIWSNGYFPLKKPFVYSSPGGYLFSFPPFFQLLSSFFYLKLGYWGLYVIPLVSALSLWLLFIGVLKRCGLTSENVAVALGILVFGTPVTLYGAIYWEHMPAVLLLFGGAALILDPRPRPAGAVLAGLACGTALWLRPESFVMDFLYGMAALVLFRNRRLIAYPAFALAMIPPMAGFLVFNKVNYGSLMGVHSYQVLQEHSFLFKIAKGFFELFLINWTAFIYFPFMILLLPALYKMWKRQWLAGLPVTLLILVTAAFCLLSPFLMPNSGGRQWGARYFLPVLPMLAAAGALVFRELVLTDRLRAPRWVAGLLLAGLVYSVLLNTVGGGLFSLRDSNYNRVKPAFDFVKQQQEKVILVNSENISMEMAVLFDRHYFFLAPADTSFQRLMPLLKGQGVREFLYISQEVGAPGLPNEVSAPRLPNLLNADTGLLKKGNYYFGKYMIP